MDALLNYVETHGPGNDSIGRVEFPEDATILSEGSAGAKPLYIIVRGTARVWRGDAKAGGGGQETVGYFTIGDHFGAAGIVAPGDARRTTIVANDDMVCLAVPAEAFGERLERAKHGLSRALAHRVWVLNNRDVAPWRELQMGEILGKGAFGRVKLVEHKRSGQTYALKCMKKSLLLMSGHAEHANSECKLLEMCNDQSVVRLFAAYQDATQVYMLLEVVMGGELYNLHSEKGNFPLDQTRFYTACVVAAISHLNSMDIMYRDLKLENLLIDNEGYLKLADFGFAKVVDAEGGHRSFTLCGTPDYMAPEVVQFRGHHLPCDWWSIGALTFEMVIGTTPFDHERPRDIYHGILQFAATGTPAPSFPWLFNGKAKDFILSLLIGEPSKRMPPAEMVAHPFLAEIDQAQMAARQLAAPHVPTIRDKNDTSNFAKDEDDDDDDDDEEDDDDDDEGGLDDATKEELRVRSLKPQLFPQYDSIM